MQTCAEGLACMEYDLTDIDKWEHLLLGEPTSFRKHKKKELEEEGENTDMYDEKHLDMPASWSMKISIPHEGQYFSEKRITNTP